MNVGLGIMTSNRLVTLVKFHSDLIRELHRVLGDTLDPVVRDHSVKSLQDVKGFTRHMNQKHLVAEHPDALLNLPKWHEAVTEYLNRSPETRVVVWTALQGLYLGMQHPDQAAKLQLRIQQRRGVVRTPVAATGGALTPELQSLLGPLASYYPFIASYLPAQLDLAQCGRDAFQIPDGFLPGIPTGYEGLGKVLVAMASQGYGLEISDVVAAKSPLQGIVQMFRDTPVELSTDTEEMKEVVTTLGHKVMDMPEFTELMTLFLKVNGKR